VIPDLFNNNLNFYIKNCYHLHNIISGEDQREYMEKKFTDFKV